MLKFLVPNQDFPIPRAHQWSDVTRRVQELVRREAD